MEILYLKFPLFFLELVDLSDLIWPQISSHNNSCGHLIKRVNYLIAVHFQLYLIEFTHPKANGPLAFSQMFEAYLIH